LNFNKPNQIELDTITISEAEKYIREDHFSDGSMLPKIQAAINFVKVTGKEAIITDASELTKNLEGTKIIK
jgi:carbamate kinase